MKKIMIAVLAVACVGIGFVAGRIHIGPAPEIQVSVSAGKDADIIGELQKQLPDDAFVVSTNALALATVNAADKAKSTKDFLASVDMSSLTDEERANHERYRQLLAERDGVMSALLSGAMDEAAVMKIVEREAELQNLAALERKALVGKIVRDLGATGDAADAALVSLERVFEATAPGGGFDGAMKDLIDIPDGKCGFSIETQTITL